nr:MAG TPA: hypothetical protein [Caudoviricetes sp.]
MGSEILFTGKFSTVYHVSSLHTTYTQHRNSANNRVYQGFCE